jgi:Tfp pilus assembly protein PilN
VSRSLNLARRPFRNERLPTLVLAVGCVVLALVTVRHAMAARDLLPGRALAVESSAVALERELRDLRQEEAGLTVAAPPVPAVKEWAAVKELVDRRAFSWTGLFADLEKSLPPSVRLVSITPQAEKGGLVLALVGAGHEVDDALALLQALQTHPHFRNAQLIEYSERDGQLEVTCRVAYLAGPAAPGRGPALSGPAGAAR